MAKKKRRSKSDRKIPKVRIARPTGRPYQIRYKCPKDGREIRISVGSRDEDEAEQMKAELEAKLLLGLKAKPGKDIIIGPDMEWDDFREQYRTLHFKLVRGSTASYAESRLDIAERILKPKTLGDIAEPNALQNLQAKLLAGAESRRKKPRSAHTVRSYMNSMLAALNWAYVPEWLPNAPRVQKIKTPKQKTMKGRPISETEFQQILGATVGVVGAEAEESWKHILRGLWASALRLGELMHVSWDKPDAIRPVWRTGYFPILKIPAAMQKNDTEESIPLLPWFESVLLETPPEKRMGWVFNPLSLQLKMGRRVRHHRPDAEWIGKVIARIGKAAGIVVEAADERTGRPEKHATAHDLRRSCGERLRDAGVPPLVICTVMRHASWDTTRKHYAPGNIQKDAQVLCKYLCPDAASEPDQQNSLNCTQVHPRDQFSVSRVHPRGVEQGAFLPGKTGFSGSEVAGCNAVDARKPEIDPGLRLVALAWPNLSDTDRKAVLRIVRRAAGKTIGETGSTTAAE